MQELFHTQKIWQLGHSQFLQNDGGICNVTPFLPTAYDLDLRRWELASLD